MRKIDAFDFQIFSGKLGLAVFFNGFYYLKWFEYPLVYNNLGFQAGERYLDIGSGKSIFPLFVLINSKCIVHTIDDQSIIEGTISYYKNTIKIMKLSSIAGDRFFIHSATKGAVQYEFDDNYFDKISCISVLEHIRNNGDSLLMATISRILKKGGRAVISFPFNNGDYIEEESPPGIGYFQRKYNIIEIQRRIIQPANLRVKKVIYFGERFASFGKLYLANKFNRINWFLPLFSPLFWKVCHSYEDEFHNFHERDLDKKNIGVVCIVFEKE